VILFLAKQIHVESSQSASVFRTAQYGKSECKRIPQLRECEPVALPRSRRVCQTPRSCQLQKSLRASESEVIFNYFQENLTYDISKKDTWNVKPGDKFYVTRNQSIITAFAVSFLSF